MCEPLLYYCCFCWSRLWKFTTTTNSGNLQRGKKPQCSMSVVEAIPIPVGSHMCICMSLYYVITAFIGLAFESSQTISGLNSGKAQRRSVVEAVDLFMWAPTSMSNPCGC